MGFEEIDHLDFTVGTRAGSLAERALRAFDQRVKEMELDLLQFAHEKIVDVLGEMNAQGCRVKVTNLRDGDGEVTFRIDGMPFRVLVAFRTDAEPGSLPTSVKLQVDARGWQAVERLSDLGRWIDKGDVVSD